MMEKKMSQNMTVFFNAIVTILTQVMLFFSEPFFSTVLGTENYGIVSVYNSWVSIFIAVFTLQTYAGIPIAIRTYGEDKLQAYQSSALALSVFSYAVFAGVTVFALCLLKKNDTFGFWVFIFALVHGLGYYCLQFLIEKNVYNYRADRNAWISLITLALAIIVSVILVRTIPKSINYFGRIAGESTVYFLSGLIACICLFRSGKCYYDREYWVFTISISVPIIFHILSGLLLEQSDRLMIQGMSGNAQAGVYSLAAVFSSVVKKIYLTLNNSWVPFSYKYFKEKQTERIIIHGKNLIELFAIIIMGFILASKEVYLVFADEEYWGGVGFIPVFAIGIFWEFMYSFPVNYEFYYKKTKIIAVVTSAVAIFNIVLNYLLISRIGIWGAVIATCISHFVKFVIHFLVASKMKEECMFPYKIKMFIPALVMLAGVVGVYYFAYDQPVFRWGLAVIMGIYISIRIIVRKAVF